MEELGPPIWDEVVLGGGLLQHRPLNLLHLYGMSIPIRISQFHRAQEVEPSLAAILGHKEGAAWT